MANERDAYRIASMSKRHELPRFPSGKFMLCRIAQLFRAVLRVSLCVARTRYLRRVTYLRTLTAARAADAIFEEGKCPSYILIDIQR